MGKKISLKDIADRVGVSTATVSYVLNGLEKEKRVSQEVVKKVKKVANELNYTPNQIARSLRKGSTNTIGLIVADIANPFFGQLARIIEDEAIKYNYTVVFGSSDENCNKSEALISTLQNRQVDGFLIVPSEGCKNQIKSLLQEEVPLVLIDRYIPDLDTNYVVLNNFQAVYDAVSHLVERGRRKIAMLAYKNSLIHMGERIRGYRQAMIDNNLAENIRVEEVPYNFERAKMEKIIINIKSEWQGEALIFATNALSLSGLYAIKDIGIKVPDDIAMVGFDGNEAFDFFSSPISFIQQPLDQMGREAVRILFEIMKNKQKNQCLQLDHKLIIRESSR